MQSVTVYLKLDRKVDVCSENVYLKDLGSLMCADTNVSARLKALKIHHFRQNEPKRCVISALKVIEVMEKEMPQINLTVENVGETDTCVEWVKADGKNGNCKISNLLKICLVCFVSFFGTAFTIMAYHNDIGINEMFRNVYKMVLNREPVGVNTLQISYSIGLFLGIIVFFNHVGGRRITKDPTPIEVSMRNYERDVDQTLIETAGRLGVEDEVSK